MNENPRRYVILIEERSDNKVAISIDKKEIENWVNFRFIAGENEDKNIEKYLIYVYPTPEDEIKFLEILKQYELNDFFENYQGVIFSISEYENSLGFLSTQSAYPDGTEMDNHLIKVEERLSNNETWAERHENIINSNIPEDLMNDLQTLNSISLSQENPRFSYLLTWIIPIEHYQSFLDDFSPLFIPF